jgi:hypothetical protein
MIRHRDIVATRFRILNVFQILTPCSLSPCGKSNHPSTSLLSVPSGSDLFGCLWFAPSPQPGETRVSCPAKSSFSHPWIDARTFVQAKRISGSTRTAGTGESRDLPRALRNGVGFPGPLRRIPTLAWLPRSFLPKRGNSVTSGDSGFRVFSWKGDPEGEENFRPPISCFDRCDDRTTPVIKIGMPAFAKPKSEGA